MAGPVCQCLPGRAFSSVILSVLAICVATCEGMVANEREMTPILNEISEALRIERRQLAAAASRTS